MKKDKKTLAWISGGIVATLIAIGLASAYKEKISAGIEFTQVEKV